MSKKEIQEKMLERLENIECLLSDILSALTPPEKVEDGPQLLNEETPYTEGTEEVVGDPDLDPWVR